VSAEKDQSDALTEKKHIGLDLWNSIMKSYPHSEKVQFAGIKALYKLGEFGSRKEREMYMIPDAFEQVLNAMRLFPDSPRVCEYSCGVLSVLTTSDAGVHGLINTKLPPLPYEPVADESDEKNNLMLQLVVEAMNRHMDTFSLIHKACGLLANVALVGENSGKDYKAQIKHLATPVLELLVGKYKKKSANLTAILKSLGVEEVV